MRARQAAALAVALTCAGAGGPAVAAVAARSPQAGGVTATEAAGVNPVTLTSPQTIPHTTTDTTTTVNTVTTTTTTVAKTAPVPKLSVCLKSARAAIAHALGVTVSAVQRKQRVGSNGMPQCNYLVRRAHTKAGPHTRAVVVVNVDNGAQAAWRLMRKVVEASQIFGPVPKGFAPPIGLNGLGPYASWFPSLDQLMANNRTRRYILTVSIIWPRAKTKEMIKLSRAAVVPYRRVGRLAA